MEKGTPDELLKYIGDILTNEKINSEDYVSDSDILTYEKFDTYLPADLLKKAFAYDRLDFTELCDRHRRNF